MKDPSWIDVLRAYMLCHIPGPSGRYRRRYRFYEHIKNRKLVLNRRIRHSGIVLPLDLGDWVQYWMYMDGAYEKHLVDFLLPLVKGKVLFDVGANVGSYTMTLTKAARHIYSFEASPANASILGNFASLSGLNNVEIINRAVSDTHGEEAIIYSSPDTGGNNTRFHDFGLGGEAVSTITLDQFAIDHGVGKVDVIKMDIEGSEFAAFRGARRILGRDRPLLLVEFHALSAKQSGWELHELYGLLSQYGYSVHELVKRKLVPFDSARLSSPDFYANLIFMPN